MPIRIQHESGCFKPVVVCDHCDEPIEDAKEGNYQWRVECGQPVDGQMFFTHKSCCRDFELANGGRVGWFWTSLDALPVFLANNLKVDWQKAADSARLFAEIG